MEKGEKASERASRVGTRLGANRSLLSHRTPILIRTRNMQAGWMPASSPAGTTGRYDACNLFLLPPIFFLPLDQLLLISRRWCLRESRRKYRQPSNASTLFSRSSSFAKRSSVRSVDVDYVTKNIQRYESICRRYSVP